MGYSFNVGPELEFFLLETNEHGEPLLTTNDQGSYFDLGPIDKGEIARQEMCLALEDMGFEIEALTMNVRQANMKLISVLVMP